MKIPEEFSKDDTIYHYCSMQTAVEYILANKKIRLSPRLNSIDPLESKKPFISYCGTNTEDDLNCQAFAIGQRASERFADVKQACFCMNNSDLYKSSFYPQLPLEYYGFLKPRMWDQYADRYKGVCLAFSKNELLKNQSQYKAQAIKYVNYNEIPLHHHSIDLDDIINLGKDEYWEKFSRLTEVKMFHKHLDYKDENELRIISFSKDSFDYIDISNSLIGIIISGASYTTSFMTDTLSKYARDYNVKALRIDWQSIGVSIYDQHKYEEMTRSFLADNKSI
jgi:hypothetical protein